MRLLGKEAKRSQWGGGEGDLTGFVEGGTQESQ